MLRHWVLFRFKADVSAEAIHAQEQAFIQLAQELHQVQAMEWGLNTSPEGLDQGFTHAYCLSFSSEAGRDGYLHHPQHQAFVAALKPLLDGVLVVDYWSREGKA
ncbi:Dabb family protein [Balneatrix alpica]|uniref:Dabb family protein n=1 Tax=Balneatrix alpica TaxID=75684 RepID=A0ABV5ZC43_9GAMM|nr:Dabb family protein [Balneatrix alpica]